MRRILCTVQQRAISPARYDELARTLVRNYRRVLGSDERISVVWCEIPDGQAFTAGAPSKVSLIVAEVPDGLDDERRTAGLRAMADGWCATAGVGADELMITLCDSSTFAGYLTAMRARVRTRDQPWYLARAATRLVVGKATRGHLTVSANY